MNPVNEAREWLEHAAAWFDREIQQAIADHVEDYGPDDTGGKRTLVFLLREEEITKLPDRLRHIASLMRRRPRP